MESLAGVTGQPTKSADAFFRSEHREEQKSLDAIVTSLRSRRHPPVVPVKKSKKKKTT
jgi:hypothetical protein